MRTAAPLCPASGLCLRHPEMSELSRKCGGLCPPVDISSPQRAARLGARAQAGLLGKMSAPSMKERKVCWGARDNYWKCLDENMDDTSKCEKFKRSFESVCPQQWVKYFDRRRDYLKYKAKLEAGEFQPSETTDKS